MIQPEAEQSQKALRVGCVQYLNALPFYYGLEADPSIPLVFKKASPTELNQWIGEDKLDTALISSLEYARNADKYVVLPHFCIGAENLSESVLMISRVPINQLNGCTVLLAQESLSSQVLLKILLHEMNLTVNFVSCPQNPEAMLSQGDACLLIGDDSLFYQIPKGYYRYDLSHLWNGITGLPFCFALWVARHQTAEARSETISLFIEDLRKNFKRNMKDPRRMIRKKVVSSENSNEEEQAEIFDKCLHYLLNLKFRLNEKMEQGLLKYFELAKKIGELNEVPKLSYFKTAESKEPRAQSGS